MGEQEGLLYALAPIQQALNRLLLCATKLPVAEAILQQGQGPRAVHSVARAGETDECERREANKTTSRLGSLLSSVSPGVHCSGGGSSGEQALGRHAQSFLHDLTRSCARTLSLCWTGGEVCRVDPLCSTQKLSGKTLP